MSPTENSKRRHILENLSVAIHISGTIEHNCEPFRLQSHASDVSSPCRRILAGELASSLHPRLLHRRVRSCCFAAASSSPSAQVELLLCRQSSSRRPGECAIAAFLASIRACRIQFLISGWRHWFLGGASSTSWLPIVLFRSLIWVVRVGDSLIPLNNSWEKFKEKAQKELNSKFSRFKFK